MGENAERVSDDLPKLESSLLISVKESLLYIGGYLVHKNPHSSATFFSRKYLLTYHRGNMFMAQFLGADYKKSTFKDQ